MKRIKLTVAYDGTNYCGWQIQPNGITIEEVLNKRLTKLTGEDIHVVGASRTDSGVHALGNVAVFDTETSIPPERLCHALNRSLPRDIVVVQSKEVPVNWHPRYCSSVKTYEYNILNGSAPDPIQRLTTYFVSYRLDLDKMKHAAKYLVGEHDFTSFCSIKTNVEDTVRIVYNLDIHKIGDKITVRIQGNGFLYNMVRIIVGTLLRVGRGFYTPEQVQDILAAKDRQLAGVTTPPQGLVLVGIEYKDVQK